VGGVGEMGIIWAIFSGLWWQWVAEKEAGNGAGVE